MNILFDYQIFQHQSYGGISRYFYELIKESGNDPNNYFELCTHYSNNRYIADRSISNHTSFGSNFNFQGKHYLVSKWNQLSALKRVKNFDLFHPTFYEDYYLERFRNSNQKFVLTVYDMIHEKFPQYFDRNGKIPKLKKKLIFESDLILAISNTTKEDLLEEYRIPEKKIIVTHLATSMTRTDSEDVHGIPDTYILYVGNRGVYKNFLGFMEGIQRILKNENVFLVCAGGGEFSDDEKQIFTNYQVTDKIFYQPINSDGQLKYLYEHAVAFIFPSLYEGFGIPVLEAFSANCPVILSDINCFREVAGDAAIYFDPKSADDIYNVVLKHVRNTQLLEKPKENANKKLLDYSWQKTYKETVQAYRSITG